eukprot:116979-Prorocentrum_minimum.AAC.4
MLSRTKRGDEVGDGVGKPRRRFTLAAAAASSAFAAASLDAAAAAFCSRSCLTADLSLVVSCWCFSFSSTPSACRQPVAPVTQSPSHPVAQSAVEPVVQPFSQLYSRTVGQRARPTSNAFDPRARRPTRPPTRALRERFDLNDGSAVRIYLRFLRPNRRTLSRRTPHPSDLAAISTRRLDVSLSPAIARGTHRPRPRTAVCVRRAVVRVTVY